MRPVPIPDSYRLEPGEREMVIAGPDGDLLGDIRPVEAIVTEKHVRVLVQLEEQDFAVWNIGVLDELIGREYSYPCFWLTFWSHVIVPFSMEAEVSG